MIRDFKKLTFTAKGWSQHPFAIKTNLALVLWNQHLDFKTKSLTVKCVPCMIIKSTACPAGGNDLVAIILEKVRQLFKFVEKEWCFNMVQNGFL